VLSVVLEQLRLFRGGMKGEGVRSQAVLVWLIMMSGMTTGASCCCLRGSFT
jgi:hypothetical protein